MKTSDFDYNLPERFIAQSPVSPRDHSKLLVFKTDTGEILHRHFFDLPDYIGENHVLVTNRSKVIPARIIFKEDGSEREIFILKNNGHHIYHVMVRPGRAFKNGRSFSISKNEIGTVIDVHTDGTRMVQFNSDIEKFGETPVPPYIKNHNVPANKYQTVYAKEKGSVAAPTAGLHFTKRLLSKLEGGGVSIEEVILHVGRGTFLPVTAEKIEDHVMHGEFFVFPESCAKRLNRAKSVGNKIVAVGTTSVRVLESRFKSGKGFVPGSGETDIFIYPGYHWNAVDALVTNFHLPKSTLIMLVASLLQNKGVKNPIEKILEIYEIAKKNKYRFYSFGDAMLII